MTDADTVRQALYHLYHAGEAPTEWLTTGLDALDRLEAERDAALEDLRDERNDSNQDMQYIAKLKEQHDALLRAARVRVEYGHSQLGMLAPEIKCSCGHDALLAALDETRGKT